MLYNSTLSRLSLSMEVYTQTRSVSTEELREIPLDAIVREATETLLNQQSSGEAGLAQGEAATAQTTVEVEIQPHGHADGSDGGGAGDEGNVRVDVMAVFGQPALTIPGESSGAAAPIVVQATIDVTDVTSPASTASAPTNVADPIRSIATGVVLPGASNLPVSVPNRQAPLNAEDPAAVEVLPTPTPQIIWLRPGEVVREIDGRRYIVRVVINTVLDWAWRPRCDLHCDSERTDAEIQQRIKEFEAKALRRRQDQQGIEGDDRGT